MRKYKNQRKSIDKNQTKSKICKSNFSPKLHGVEVKHTKHQGVKNSWQQRLLLWLLFLINNDYDEIIHTCPEASSNRTKWQSS